MPDGMPESGGGLAGEGAARSVGDGAGDDQRQPPSAVLEIRLDGIDGGLGVERVENGFQQQQVRAAFRQSAHGRGVGVRQFLKAGVAEAGPVHVRREGGGAVGGAERAGNEAGLFRRGLCVGSLTGQDGAGPVQVMDVVLQFVIGHGDGRGIEGIGADDVRAGVEKRAVYGPDDSGLRERQQVVVALQLTAVPGKAFAAKISLLQAVGLDHGAHGPVQQQDALFQQVA